jgi:hypothetical protein
MALQPGIARAVSRLRGQLRHLQQVGRAEVEEAVGRVGPIASGCVALGQRRQVEPRLDQLQHRGAVAMQMHHHV